MIYKHEKSAVEIAGIIAVGGTTVYQYLEEMGQELNLQSANNQ